ncbi:MAG: hypothetical protein AAGB24_06165 [Bacteroidota bacterium]
MKKRNYINAIIELTEGGSRTEVIFKVGDVDIDDDVHVFAHLKSEKEIEFLEHPNFKVIEFWKGKRLNQKRLEFDADDFDDWMRGIRKYSPEP